MEREIKFRGLRADGKGWVYGYYIAYRVTGGGILYHHIKNPSDTFMVSVESVGQYTGLKDKNGVDIYEGDIIKYPTYYETPEMCPKEYSKEVVVFEQGAFFLKEKRDHYLSEQILATVMHDYDGDFEIIGNIHDIKTT